MWTILTSILLLLVSMAFGAEARLPSAQELLLKVRQTSAKEVLNEIFSNQSLEEQLKAQISSGKPEWLEVASALKPASDAGSSEMLEMAAAAALPNNPSGVLGLVGPGFSISWICGAPEFEVPPEKTLRHLRRSLRALKKVKNPSAAEAKKRCVDTIENLIRKIKKKPA